MDVLVCCFNQWVSLFSLPGISSNPSKTWLVLHIMFARHVKKWASAGCKALVNVKSYSQAVKPFSTKKIK